MPLSHWQAPSLVLRSLRADHSNNSDSDSLPLPVALAAWQAKTQAPGRRTPDAAGLPAARGSRARRRETSRARMASRI